MRNPTSLLVLKKVVRSNQNQSIFLDTIAEAQAVAKKVIDKLIEDFSAEESCAFTRDLELSNLAAKPIWGLNSCDGYEIELSYKTDL